MSTPVPAAHAEEALALQATAFAELGALRLEAAEAAAAEALRLDPSLVGARVCRASVLMAQRRSDEAIAVLEEAARLAPADATVLLSLGMAEQARGDLERARSLIVRSGELRPLDWQVYLALAGLELAAARPESGLRDADLAIALGGDVPNAHLLRGIFLAKLGRAKEAKEALASAAAVGPEDSLARALLERLQAR